MTPAGVAELVKKGHTPQERAGIPQQAEPDGAAIVADHQGAVNRRKTMENRRKTSDEN